MIQKRGEFLALYGEAISRWAMLEAALGHSFATILSSRYGAHTGEAVFFSTPGFGSRAGMFEALLNSGVDKDIQKFYRPAIGKARRYSSIRNKLAHGQIVHDNSAAGSKWIVREFIDLKISFDEVRFKDPLDAENIANSILHFSALSDLTMDALVKVESGNVDLSAEMAALAKLPDEAHLRA